MVSEDEQWIKSALSDDSAVAELLLLLHRSPPASETSALRLDWSVRQRRSSAKDAGGLTRPPGEKAGGSGSARASPTTPLSWGGGTSSADGAEESSLPPTSTDKHRSNSSKVSSCIGITSVKATTKRSRRKKRTLAELKREESSLLNEQKSLRHELANLRALMEKHRLMNQRLNNFKLGMQHGLGHHGNPCSNVRETDLDNGREAMFELPDLNLPVEDFPIT